MLGDDKVVCLPASYLSGQSIPPLVGHCSPGNQKHLPWVKLWARNFRKETRNVIDMGVLSFVRCRARTHTVFYALTLEASPYSRSLTHFSHQLWPLEKRVWHLTFLIYSLPYGYLHLMFRTSSFPYDTDSPVGLNCGRLCFFQKKRRGDIRRRVISKIVGFSVIKLPLRTVISCWHTLERFKNPGQ